MTNHEKTLSYFEPKNICLLKKLKVKLKHYFGWLGAPQIIPYRGYGSSSSEKVYIMGALVEDSGLEKADEKNSLWENMLAMLKRYSSDRIKGAHLEVELNEERKALITDETGLFNSVFHTSPILDNNNLQWINFNATILIKRFGEKQEQIKRSGEILIPGKNAKFGIISDIDDTIMVSHSTQILRKLRLMLTRNSRTRKPFPGVEEFYRALYLGTDGKSENPFFYISSSEWNLYDLIDDFCSFNKFPKGVYLLRELKPGIFNLWNQGGGNHEHKFDKIEHLFHTYPDMSFVLIGDNGQHDPDIYARIAQSYPNRIKAIYIRTVKRQKNKQMKKLMSDMEEINVPLVFTPDTLNAAQHARSHKLIAPSAIHRIIENSFQDE